MELCLLHSMKIWVLLVILLEDDDMNISERVEKLILNKDYDELSNLTFKIDLDYLIDNLDKEKKDAYISWIMKANFKLKKYDYNIFFIERLILSGKENYELYVYLFCIE